MTLRQNPYAIKRFHNENVAPPGDYASDPGAFIPVNAFDAARREISAWPGYEPTPLLALDGLAKALGIASLRLKYEAPRFGLGSFKALGGAYAVSLYLKSMIREATGNEADTQSLLAGTHAGTTKNITVCSATDGNHGRSVAWGAQMFGCRCVIYVPHHTSQGRIDAIAAFGAEVIRHHANYDDTVRQCASVAAENGWTVISDTSYDGYTQIPLDVMSGYTVLVAELLEQLPAGERPTHVFVQGGVGGFASGVIAPMWHHWGADRPKFIFINPDNAAAMLRSAEAGSRVAIEGDLETVMACLSCGELSLLAWQLLKRTINDTIAIPDEAATDTMRTLAHGVNGDAPVVAGESGCAGIAGLIAAVNDTGNDGGAKEALGLDADSRVLCICTEGATDPALYAEIVGKTPEQVMA